ncbi:MAG: lipopolysaccharide biosynthesis regulator YciM [Cellvibrionaceae bacterium]
MIDWILYFALLLAVAIGFWQGRRVGRKKFDTESCSLKQQYVQGLNFLLNEQPDAAVTSFINALDVNSETLETHLALGKLLRRRGEVDRAIRIHQNLLARPGLSRDQAREAHYELACDFMVAGLLDRAERLLQELTEEEGPFQNDGLQRLLEIFRDEKEWKSGLAVLNRLSGSRFSKQYEKWAPTRAHFCCELAEQATTNQKLTSARQYLKQALNYDKNSARAILLSGRVEIIAGSYTKGIQELQRIAEQNPAYISEALPYLEEGYSHTGNLRKYRDFLAKAYAKDTSPMLMLAMANAIARESGDHASADFLAEAVVERPSGKALHELLDYYIAFSDGKSRPNFEILQVAVSLIASQSAYYQCNSCGFKGQELHWLCPSCKQWGQIEPLKYSQGER